MKFIVLSLLAATCSAAPQLYQTVAGTVASPQWNLPAVMKIPEPGVNLGMVLTAPAPVPVVKAAPVPVPVVKAAPSLTVVEAAPVAVAPVAPLVKSAAIVAPAAPVAVAPMVRSAVPVTVVAAPEPLMAPEPPMPSLSVPHVGGQFHAQDEAGQYTFGHYGGPSTRVETRDSLGRTSGSFAYVDPEGDVQVRKYAAAPGSGFRVAASDLVEDTPAVAQVKSAHARAHQAVKSLTVNSVVTLV
ncbi:cuticle protein 19.8-like [Penaeus vannamei]|uniref:cuticle protein 19.8-like n=1 Tax=Penaeus vannamei TaxID=6689 RepID=UPI00387F4355